MSNWKKLALAAVVAAGLALNNEEEIKSGFSKAKSWVKEKLKKRSENHPKEKDEESSNQKSKFSIPDHFLCPLTGELMQDPVITPEGICFERSEIEKYLKIQEVCPLTGKPLTTGDLTPSVTLRLSIKKFKETCMNTI
jgi:hypothetical protein